MKWISANPLSDIVTNIGKQVKEKYLPYIEVMVKVNR